MEETIVLYLVRADKGGGYVHYREKSGPMEHSDALSAKFAVATQRKENDPLLELSKDEGILFYAIDHNKRVPLRLQVILPNVESQINSPISFVKTEYGIFWFRMKEFEKYTGTTYRGFKMYELEPLSDTELERLCIEKQFFFVGS